MLVLSLDHLKSAREVQQVISIPSMVELGAVSCNITAKELRPANDDHYPIMYSTVLLWTSVTVLVSGLYFKRLLNPHKHANTTIMDP